MPGPIAVTHDPQWLLGGIEVLYDPGRDLALRQVMAPSLCAQFRWVQGTPAFGYERRGIWLRWRLTFPTGMAASPRLLVPDVGTDRVCAHWPVTVHYNNPAFGPSSFRWEVNAFYLALSRRW